MTLEHSAAASRWRRPEIALAAAALTIVAVIAYGGAVAEAARRWSGQEEYSHGFVIPMVSAWLLWTRRQALGASIDRPSWLGSAAIILAMLLHMAGELSALFILSQLGLILALLGVVLCVGGMSLLRVTLIPILFLGFAIPLPYVLDSELSLRLQLLSSELGATLIRALQIPVFLEGNVIDLGRHQLQVVEACSGLRYLYPLLSLGFLAALLLQAPLWQRALVFLSALPVTIAMNSLRLMLVAVLVETWGTDQAQGPLHFFEGWVIFLACAGLLVGEAYLLARLGPAAPFPHLFCPPHIKAPAPGARERPHARYARRHAHVLAAFLMLGATGLSGLVIAGRHEVIPDRLGFASFPKRIGAWHGTASSLAPQVEHFLGLTDYVLSDYARPDGRPVNLYVAYYASQRKGVSPHSPQVCIPGNGWQISRFERTSYRDADTGLTLPLNRVVIERGSDKQLVYYWFEQRGRRIANEFMSKLHLIKDAIYLNRTDGALVRLTTPLYPGEEEAEADRRLETFARDLVPDLSRFLPRAPAWAAH